MVEHKKKPGGKKSFKPKWKGSKNKQFKKKFCRFCADNIEIDYKNVGLLKNYITDRGKMLSSRFTGVCVKHQRILTRAIKRARNIAIIPFASL
ncbi:MAG: 30S ribosomal protein S18 [Elusimicrobia bacterium RIFOXYC2_FULL_34_12]|nr:MAG: 30S ribosomal protein S18 [Elusimicrobia bacterium RIFOXYC2_FULL_34_12]OGS38037.1 MAG: 30S ribosomal protein S18 [Elusimicrobia bacterium RIFOXYD2_FULL_34_30]